MSVEIGKPRQSLRTMSLVPLPRLVLPMPSPLFGRCEHAVSEALATVDLVVAVELPRQVAPRPIERAIAGPLDEPPVDGRV